MSHDVSLADISGVIRLVREVCDRWDDPGTWREHLLRGLDCDLLVTSGAYDVAFLMRPTPVEQVREIAAAGQSMPPKSTYFFPKVLTGLLFNPLGDSA